MKNTVKNWQNFLHINFTPLYKALNAKKLTSSQPLLSQNISNRARVTEILAKLPGSGNGQTFRNVIKVYSLSRFCKGSCKCFSYKFNLKNIIVRDAENGLNRSDMTYEREVTQQKASKLKNLLFFGLNGLPVNNFRVTLSCFTVKS